MKTLVVPPEITRFLSHFDLTDTQITIYFSLLKTGPQAISVLADACQLPLTTTFDNCDKLSALNLIDKKGSGKQVQYEAASPLTFAQLLTQKQAAESVRALQLKSMEKELPYLIKRLTEQTQVNYFYGKEELRSMYQKAMESSEVRSIFTMEKYYQLWTESERAALNQDALGNAQRKVYDIITDAISPRELVTEIRKTFPNYHVKFFPMPTTQKDLGCDIVLFDNQVVMTEIAANHVFGTVIKSEIVFRSLWHIHQAIWNTL